MRHPTITPQQAAEALVARATQRHAAVEARRLVIRGKLSALADMLRTRYGAQRVMVFGSLAWGGFHAQSDVDVAVEGIASERLWQATTDANEGMPATVELFALESLPQSFRQRVLAEGELLV